MNKEDKIKSDEYEKAVADNVRGYTPIDLDSVQHLTGVQVEQIKNVLGDIICAEYVDELPTGEVLRDGIVVSASQTTNLWRRARIVKLGPLADKTLNIGDIIVFPSDRGIKMVALDKQHKYIFINAERIFCTVNE